MNNNVFYASEASPGGALRRKGPLRTIHSWRVSDASSGTHKPLRPKRVLTFLIVVALTVLLGTHVYAAVPAEEHSPAQRVATQHAQVRTIMTQVTATGRWVAREEVTIMAPLDGVRVRDVRVDSGAQVQEGQVLAHLERSTLATQVEQSQQGIERSKAELLLVQSHMKEAATAFSRAKRLQHSGAISVQELEAAAAAYASTQAECGQAQAFVRQMRAQAEAARIQLAHADIKAPVAGLIVERQVQTGALVNAQTPLFTLVRDGELEFSAQAPALALTDVFPGMTAQLMTPSLDVQGRVRLVGARVNSDTGYGDVRITAIGGAPQQLRVGTAGSARMILDQREVMALDVRALRYANNGQVTYVYIVGADQRVKRTNVIVGRRDGEWIEIKEGITPQDTVVLAGAALLSEGEKVESALVSDVDASVQP